MSNKHNDTDAPEVECDGFVVYRTDKKDWDREPDGTIRVMGWERISILLDICPANLLQPVPVNLVRADLPRGDEWPTRAQLNLADRWLHRIRKEEFLALISPDDTEALNEAEEMWIMFIEDPTDLLDTMWPYTDALLDLAHKKAREDKPTGDIS